MKCHSIRDLVTGAIEASFDYVQLAEAILAEVESRLDYDAIAERIVDAHDFEDLVSAHLEATYCDRPY